MGPRFAHMHLHACSVVECVYMRAQWRNVSAHESTVIENAKTAFRFLKSLGQNLKIPSSNSFLNASLASWPNVFLSFLFIPELELIIFPILPCSEKCCENQI